jgi:hypothetical protein
VTSLEVEERVWFRDRAMPEPGKREVEEPVTLRQWMDSFEPLRGRWTEADEIWLECMTGEFDRRQLREIYARESAEADL